MDEISLLRRARTDIPERTPDEISRGRTALFAAIEDESPFAVVDQETGGAPARPKPVKRRRTAAAWTGFSLLGASAVTLTLVAVNLVGIPGVEVGGAEPAAASVLESAARATLQFSDPVVGAGQYLRVRTDAVYMTQTWLEEDVDAARVNGEVQDLQTVAPQTYMQGEHLELFRPADPNDTWWQIQCRASVAETFGPKSELAAQQDPSVTEGPIGHLIEMPGGRMKYESPDGQIESGNPVGGFTVPGGASDDFTQLPLEPATLLAEIHRLNAGSGPSPDGQALVWIADTLRSGTVPAEYRAAMYQAAALIPGVTITDEQATLNGTTGIAIGRDETNDGIRQEIIIDPATGQFIGERRVALEGYGAVAAGTTVGWTAVTTEIVEAAPTDASTCST